MEKQPFTKDSAFVGVKNPSAEPEPKVQPGGAGGGEFKLQLFWNNVPQGYLDINSSGWVCISDTGATLRWIGTQITITNRGYMTWSPAWAGDPASFKDWAYRPDNGWKVDPGNNQLVSPGGAAVLSMYEDRKDYLYVDPTYNKLTVKIVY